MVNKKLVKKAAVLASTVVIAGHTVALGADGMVIAKLINPDIISTVCAAEAHVLTGQWVYVQNDAGNPDAVVNVNADGTLEVGMYLGTMIQLGGTAGSSLQVNAEPGIVATVVAPDGISILVAGNQVGSQTIQVQDTVTGAVTNVVVNVVDANGTIIPAETTEQTGVHPGVANGYYSYADNHKVVSADGRWEINLDQLFFLRKTSVPAPVVYYGEDGMLTVEAYNLSGVLAGCTILDNNYRFGDGIDEDGLHHAGLPAGQYAGLGGGNKTEVEWMKLRAKDGNGEAINVLPVRNINLGSAFANGAEELELPERVTYYPTTFTVK